MRKKHVRTSTICYLHQLRSTYHVATIVIDVQLGANVKATQRDPHSNPLSEIVYEPHNTAACTAISQINWE